MITKLRTATFKFMDMLVILTMVLASPMSISAMPMPQDSSPSLEVNPSDYAPGEAAHVIGTGFAPGDYVLAVNSPEMQWGPVTADSDGNFTSDSPTLDSAGNYEIRAYTSPWSGAWDEPAVASATFTVTAPPPPTEPPTEEPTSTPTDEPTSTPTDEPTQEATATDTPTDEPTPAPTDTATSEPTSTSTNTPTPEASPTITSDQADYPQGGLVTLNGANWQGDSQVRIIVNDDIGQTWRRDVTVSVAADGTITDSFSLPSFFVATFNVVARGVQTDRVATTSFTDAPKITAKTHQGQEKPAGTYTSGNITTYQEGDRINFRFTLEANEASSGQLQVRFTGNDGTCLFFDGVFTLGTHDSSAPAIQPISGATPTVTTVGAPVATSFGTSNGEWVQTLNITFSAAGEAVVNYYLELSDEAGQCNGSSQHSRLNPAGGDVGQSGQQNVPVPANQIIELPEITVTKNIDRDGNGSFEDTADAGEYCFTLDGGSCVPTNSSGQVTFINVTPNGAHTITETQLLFNQGTYSFISGSGTNCTFSGSTATATVTSGTTSTDATCVFNNGLTNGMLTIVKVVINDNGGTKQISDFPLFYNGTPATSGVANTVSPGTYTVTETQQTGYTATFSGDCNSSGVVTVGAGQNKTCTITNDDQPGTLIVKKVVVNNNGGTKAAVDFSFSVNNGTAVPFEADGQNDLTVNAGTYTVTEPAVAGYSTTYSNCSDVVVPNGGSATCTITNDDQAATLIVKKVVINNNGGTKTAVDFSFSVNGGSTTAFEADGQNDLSVSAGIYSVTEPTVSGYTTTYNNCSNVSIPNGGSATCTITNDDQAAHLKLVKVVSNDNGGTAVANDFTLSANGPTPISGAGGAESDVNAGIYTLSETTLPGYTASAWSCVGGSQNNDQITLVNGESATCTITNSDKAPSLTLVKVVVNNNGGTALTTAFTLSANGPTPISGAGGATSDATFDAGTYDLSETSVPGYSASAWVCAGGIQDDADTVTVGLGQDVTCTITNDDQAATLIVIKHVINDNGGTADAGDFTMTVNGTNVQPNASFPGAESPGTTVTLNAGSFSVSESSVPGYTSDGGSVACSGTIANGETKTCTFTNNDNTPSLTLVKTVINDNGGTAGANQWTLTATGPTGFSGSGPSVSNGASFDAGTYDLSETGPAGYSAGNWVCVGGNQTNGNTVEVGLGEDVTCTITNNDDAPSLTLIKQMINDNGGTALANAFTLSANGPTPISGAGGATSDATFEAGTYDLSETSVPGYTASDWVCTGGTQNDEDTVTVGLGEDVTCTITNDDNAPSLTLVKTVVNDNGGTATTAQWTLTASGPTGFSGAGPSVSSNVSFDAGTYALSESGPAGYTASAWSCVGGTQNGSNITLALGESATCTITNNDNAPSLTLVKVVVNDNGGTAVATNFTLSANGPTPISGAGGTTSDTSFDAGTYNLSETGPAGYSASDWLCTGGTQDDTDTITLGLGESATCTITNDDQAPSLTLVKVVTNNDGGNAVTADWTLTATGPTGFSGPGPSVSNGASFDAGSYNLSESGAAGYTASNWVCDGGTQDDADTITLGLGESATCTITNNDVAPTLTLIKTVANDDGGNAVVAEFPLFISGNSVTSGVANILSANTPYTASETNLTGYTASAWGGDCAPDGTITLNEGQNAICTITNDDVAPTLKLVKVVNNDNGGNAVADDWTLSADAAAPFDGRNFDNAGGSGVFESIFANHGYDLSETTLPGYTAGNWSCDGGTLVGSTVTLMEGETDVTCSITNDDIAPQLRLVKTVVNDDGGNAVIADFPLFIDGNSVTSGVFVPVTANAAHTASETTQTGYTASAWGGDCAADGTITLNEGEVKTCSITNDDVAPTLKLVKNVITDNGGSAVANDWTLSAAAAVPFDGRNFSNAGGSGVLQTVFANAGYDLSETTLSGYTAGAWSCDGGTLVGSTVTLTEGETGVICTITNDDQPGTLIVIKHVINDNGGTADAGDFTLDSGGANDTPDDFAGQESGTTVTLDAGAYNVTETGPSGYSASFSADCSGTIANGETKTCTVTNDDIQPQLIVIKNVINDNGGTATASNFTMSVTGNNVSPASFPGSEAGTNVTLNAGSYNVSETGPSGYAASYSANCTGSIAVGETKTCTVTNNDIAPTLTVTKILLPNNDTGKFNLRIDGVNQATNVGNNGTTGAVAVNVGVHTVSETAGTGTSLANYVTTIGGDCAADGTIHLALAENKTCTITNARRGTIIVEKQTNPNAAPGSFTFSGDAVGTIADNGTIVVSNLAPGTYTSTEADPSPLLFALASIACNDGSSANPSTGNLATRTATFRLDPGETVRCVFTNTKDFHAGTIGFWKNWRNHYNSTQFQSLINYLKTNNPKIYNKDLILNNTDDFTIAKHDAIMKVGSATPREQMILAQFTALKFNLAITQLDGTGGLVQKNDDLCTAGVVNVSGISGASTFFGTSTPTVGQIVNAVENRWTGKLTTTRSDWKWNLTSAQKDMLIKVISGINEGTLVMSSGCQ